MPQLFVRPGSPLASAVRFTADRHLQDGEVDHNANDPALSKLGVSALGSVAFSASGRADIARSFGGIARPNAKGTYGNNRLEGTPHGPIHNYVGGEGPGPRPGDMSDFETAGRDPIFFAHHGNLDRLWEIWRKDPARKASEPKSCDFLDHEFPFTWLDGTTITVKVLPDGAVEADGKQVFGYLTVPEDAKVGVCSHELGHLLFGWADLYDTTNASSGLGDFCLMAGGSWGGQGNRPCHPSAWCKAQQGWVRVEKQTAAGRVALKDVKAGGPVLRLWTGGAAGLEYFLLENRQQTGFDASLPGAGLLLYHVDDGQTGNTDARHYKVGLLQADGLHGLEHGSDRGDGGDPFPGSSGRLVCDAVTDPGTLSYAGSRTGIALRNITAAGAAITLDVEISDAAA